MPMAYFAPDDRSQFADSWIADWRAAPNFGDASSADSDGEAAEGDKIERVSRIGLGA
jgi:hypothetical protein